MTAALSLQLQSLISNELYGSKSGGSIRYMLKCNLTSNITIITDDLYPVTISIIVSNDENRASAELSRNHVLSREEDRVTKSEEEQGPNRREMAEQGWSDNAERGKRSDGYKSLDLQLPTPNFDVKYPGYNANMAY